MFPKSFGLMRSLSGAYSTFARKRSFLCSTRTVSRQHRVEYIGAGCMFSRTAALWLVVTGLQDRWVRCGPDDKFGIQREQRWYSFKRVVEIIERDRVAELLAVHGLVVGGRSPIGGGGASFARAESGDTDLRTGV